MCLPSFKIYSLLRGLCILIIVTVGCGSPKDDSSHLEVSGDSIKDKSFPRFIEGGNKVVYLFGKMASRGLKHFLDTVTYSENSLVLPDSVKPKFLFPLMISESERNTAPGIIAISLPGFWEETIFGMLDTSGRLRMNYKGKEHYFLPAHDLSFKVGKWSGEFRDDDADVRISVVFDNTKVGDHLAGKGKLQLRQRETVTEEEVFFVVRKGMHITKRL